MRTRRFLDLADKLIKTGNSDLAEEILVTAGILKPVIVYKEGNKPFCLSVFKIKVRCYESEAKAQAASDFVSKYTGWRLLVVVAILLGAFVLVWKKPWAKKNKLSDKEIVQQLGGKPGSILDKAKKGGDLSGEKPEDLEKAKGLGETSQAALNQEKNEAPSITKPILAAEAESLGNAVEKIEEAQDKILEKSKQLTKEEQSILDDVSKSNSALQAAGKEFLRLRKEMEKLVEEDEDSDALISAAEDLYKGESVEDVEESYGSLRERLDDIITLAHGFSTLPSRVEHLVNEHKRIKLFDSLLKEHGLSDTPEGKAYFEAKLFKDMEQENLRSETEEGHFYTYTLWLDKAVHIIKRLPPSPLVKWKEFLNGPYSLLLESRMKWMESELGLGPSSKKFKERHYTRTNEDVSEVYQKVIESGLDLLHGFPDTLKQTTPIVKAKQALERDQIVLKTYRDAVTTHARRMQEFYNRLDDLRDEYKTGQQKFVDSILILTDYMERADKSNNYKKIGKEFGEALFAGNLPLSLNDVIQIKDHNCKLASDLEKLHAEVIQEEYPIDHVFPKNGIIIMETARGDCAGLELLLKFSQ